jgi:hypothetical protein
MPIVVEGVSMKEFVYRKYIDALLNIVEDDPDLELLEQTSSSIVTYDSTNNYINKFDLSSLQNSNYLLEVIINDEK